MSWRKVKGERRELAQGKRGDVICDLRMKELLRERDDFVVTEGAIPRSGLQRDA